VSRRVRSLLQGTFAAHYLPTCDDDLLFDSGPQKLAPRQWQISRVDIAAATASLMLSMQLESWLSLPALHGRLWDDTGLAWPPTTSISSSRQPKQRKYFPHEFLEPRTGYDDLDSSGSTAKRAAPHNLAICGGSLVIVQNIGKPG
jgi:hypothetical protein